jgi:hypothetical protein
MDAQFGAAPTTQTLIPTQTEGVRPLSVEDMDAQFADAKAVPHPYALLAGAYNGAMRTVDKPAEDLSDQMAKSGFSGTVRNFLTSHGVSAATANRLLPAQGQEAVNDASDRKSFNQAYGGNTTASLGNLLGQTAVIAPLISGGGALLGGAAGGASALLADAYPLASRIIQGGAKLIGGTAGADAPGVAGTATRVASTAANGSAVGASAAALTGQPVKQGGEYGALLGPVGAIVSKGIGLASDVGKNLLSPITDLSDRATQAAAVNKLVQAFKADGMTASEAIAKVQALGQNGMLADVGGANVRNAAETVASSPGPGSNTAEQALESRAESQGARVNQAVKDATGVNGNIHDEADQLIAQRAQEAAPLYKVALDQDKNPVFSSKLAVDPRLAQFANDPIIQQGMQRGAEVARLDALAKGEPFDPSKYLWNTTPEVPAQLVPASRNGIGAKLTPDTYIPGTPQNTTVSMNALDAAKRGLDDILEQYRDPVTGKLNLDQRGKAINDVRSAFVDHLDSINPDYAAARQAYAGPSQSLDAMNMGKRALANDPEVNAKIVGNLSPGDKQFYLQGVTRALQDKIAGAQDGADVTRRIFGNDLIRNKIAAAFDDPQAFANFEQQMQAESTFAQTRNQVLKGSQTARRLAGQADASQPLVNAGMHLLSGNVGSALASGAKGVANYLLQPSQAQSSALGNLLFTPGNAGAQQLQQALERMQPGAAKKALNQLMQGGNAAALPAATMGAQQAYGN